MWQQLLERFVPLMDGDASVLDRRDGVGRSIADPVAHESATAGAQGTHTAYPGAFSPLTS